MGWFDRNKDSKNADKNQPIFEKVMSNINSILERDSVRVMMSPVTIGSKSFYIINAKEISISILVNPNSNMVKIVNHAYHYSRSFNDNEIERFVNVIEAWVMKDRNKLLDELFQNEMDLLDDIESKLKTVPIVDESFAEEIPVGCNGLGIVY